MPWDIIVAVATLAEQPLPFRFVLQPLMAILLGLRDAKLDVDAGKGPYVWSVIRGSSPRRERIMSGMKVTAIPLGVAVILDCISQTILYGKFRLLDALLVGIALVALPYMLSRGLGNRAIQKMRTLRHA